MKNEIRSETTRRRIMQAAALLFASQGYAAAGVAEICAAAGVSKGAFYHHFAGKNALFAALLEVWLSDLDARLESLASQDIPFPQILVEMARLIDEIYVLYRDQIMILFEFWMQASRDREVWQAVIRPFHRYEAFFTRMICKGIQEGSLTDIDPQAAARALISLAVGLLLQSMLLSQTVPAGQAVPALNGFGSRPAQDSIDILLHGLEKKL